MWLFWTIDLQATFITVTPHVTYNAMKARKVEATNRQWTKRSCATVGGLMSIFISELSTYELELLDLTALTIPSKLNLNS